MCFSGLSHKNWLKLLIIIADSVMAALHEHSSSASALNIESPSSSYIEAIEASELELIQHVKTSGLRKQVTSYSFFSSA